jgi:zinc transport system ATP-binding protein
MSQTHEHETHHAPSSSGGLCCTRISSFGVTLGQNEIIKDVSLHIHCGELTAIIGPNGAGKSTLLKAILGEIPHSGELAFLDEKDRHNGRPLIGYVPQKLEFDTSSPASVYDLFAAALSMSAVWLFRPKKVRSNVLQSLEKAGAGQLIDRRLGALSGGELQRVMLALALNPVPDLLLLDEPVSGVDHNGMQLFYKTVSALRRDFDLSIILISHDFDLVAEYADRVVLMNNGMVECAGAPRDVFASSAAAKVFGLNLLAGTQGGADK